MLIESKIKIGHDSMFNIPQTNFKSAHLLNKIALVQFQRNRTVTLTSYIFHASWKEFAIFKHTTMAQSRGVEK